MILSCLFFYFFTNIYVFFIAINAQYICDKNVTIHSLISLNEITFFQTQNYPSFFSYEDFISCNLTFSLINDKNQDYKLYAVFIQLETLTNAIGYIENDVLTNIEISNNSIFNFHCVGCNEDENANHYFDQLSQQGFVIFDTGIDGCPLETISKPFFFSDETQIIYIQSSFEKNYFRQFPCTWSFETSLEFAFKIVIEQFSIASDTVFRISNSTDLLVNERSAKLLHPIYNNDKVIKIFLSENNNMYFVPEMEFRAYISIVEKNPIVTELPCIIDDSYKLRMEWSYLKGYPKNGYCSFEISIPQNTLFIVEIEILELEKNVDIIRYNLDDNNLARIESMDDIYFLPFNDGLERNITFEFISDGSVQMLGFDLIFSIYSCECGDSQIKCGTGMNLFMNGSDKICGGMSCNFTLQPCFSQYSLFQTWQSLSTIDTFRLFSDNDVIYDLRVSNDDIFEIVAVLNSSNYNFVEVITNPTASGHNLDFYLFPLAIPEVLDVELSIDKLYRIGDMGLNTCVFIKFSETVKENTSLVFYSNVPYDITIFNDKSFSKGLLGYYCLGNDDKYRCKIKRKEFLACSFRTTGDLGSFAFFAVRKSEKPKGCVFDESIFPTRENQIFSISALSTPDDECDVILLVHGEYNYTISHLWTTSTNENVKIFFGENREKMFFEFNSKTAPKYNSIILLSKVYLIQIPKRATVFITLLRMNNNAIIFPQTSFNSFYSTPYYGSTKMLSGVADEFIQYVVHENPVTFIVINFKMSSNDTFKTNIPNLKITGIGDSFTLQNTVIAFTYHSGTKNNVDGGILFYITSENNIKIL